MLKNNCNIFLIDQGVNRKNKRKTSAKCSAQEMQEMTQN